MAVGRAAAVLYSHAGPARYRTRVKLFLDICLGLGLAQAVGLRPFLPALVAGGFAAGDVLIDFDGTDFAFLENPSGCSAGRCSAVGALILRNEIAARPPLGGRRHGLGMGIGALLFAAVLDDDGYAWWPGIPAGIAAAWLSGTAARDLLARAAGRLDDEARAHLPVYTEGVALALAALSIVAPPVGLVALGLLRLAADRRPPARGREVRRPARPALTVPLA